MLHPLYWLHLFYFFHFAVANRRDDNHHGGNLVVAGAPVRYLFFFFLWPADFDYYYYYCFDRMKKCGQTNQMSLPSCVTWFPIVSHNILRFWPNFNESDSTTMMAFEFQMVVSRPQDQFEIIITAQGASLRLNVSGKTFSSNEFCFAVDQNFQVRPEICKSG